MNIWIGLALVGIICGIGLMVSWWVLKSLFGIGSVGGAILAWSRNKSVGMAIVGFLLGWIYIIYWVITYQKKENPPS